MTWYVYRWNRMGRKGQKCVVLCRGKMNSCWIRFEDGFEAVTSRNALRRYRAEMKLTCAECGKDFHPHRERIFDNKPQTCGKPECQRARKTRLQKESRDQARKSDPRRRHAGPGYSGWKMDNIAAAARREIRQKEAGAVVMTSTPRARLKQRRSTLPQT